MTAEEGKRALRRLLGKEAFWQDFRQPSSPESRAEAKAALVPLSERWDAVNNRILRASTRRSGSNSTEREELLREQRELKHAREPFDESARYYRLLAGNTFALGAVPVFAFRGDNWADLIRNVKEVLARKRMRQQEQA